MTDVALFDMSVAAAYAQLNPGGSLTKIYVGLQFYVSTAQQTAWIVGNNGPLEIDGSGFAFEGLFSNGVDIFGNGTYFNANAVTADAWHQAEMAWDITSGSVPVAVDGVVDSDTYGPNSDTVADVLIGMFGTNPFAAKGMYVATVWIGTDVGLHDILLEDWSSADFSNWSSTSGNCSIVSAPSVPPAFSPALGAGPPIPAGRVLIAFDAGPHDATPTWTAIDQGGDFPDQFVSGYDTTNGRQTLLSQTETGTATVFINDHDEGLFDPRNSGSPYFGKLDGRQIMLQLYNPVTAIWEQEFQGWIDDITWTIDPTAVNAAGEPINASIQIEAVDVFDVLAGFGLTPGLAGITPPVGMEDGVYYAHGHVDDRMIEILTDVGINSGRYGSPSLASGNVNTIAVKYDPDESALSALRDAADAEFPFISNIYVDRFGKFQFRGRYGRFAPDSVSAEPGSDWDFTRWAVGDGAAIQSDPTRAQMRVLAFQRSRSEIINVAVCYPQGIKPSKMPDQVFADTTSITNYGKHDAPPMSDLLTADDDLTSGSANARVECFHYAKLLVLNQKDPREAVSALQVKTVHPDDPRAEATWAFLTQSDIGHIVNVAVGYPGGTGFAGDSPDDDYYIEGRSLSVRPLDPGFDYVEHNVEVSPAVWSMDTHGVFPPFS